MNGEVQSLRAGRRHDVGRVAGQEEASVPHRLGDEAAHRRDPLLEHRALRERPAGEAEPDLQLLPDALVGPLGDVLVGAALDVEAARAPASAG